ncbi:MAG TPA: DUF1648 domain-containing protein [Wenzhouxiangella sp.]|nr:DUF1648 domain-containing protein [Wenzhouxiangella sp.]
MMVRKGLLFSIPLFVAIALLGLAGWLMTPEGQAIAVHWNMAGEVDRTTGPIEAFLAIPGTALVLIAVFAIAPAIDPRGRNLQRSKPLWLTAWIETHRRRTPPASDSTPAILAGGFALFAGLAGALVLGAGPGAIIGLVGVGLASRLLRQHQENDI